MVKWRLEDIHSSTRTGKLIFIHSKSEAPEIRSPLVLFKKYEQYTLKLKKLVNIYLRKINRKITSSRQMKKCYIMTFLMYIQPERQY